MARILVIDDESNLRMMVRLALEQAGHQVETAEDGPTGLEAFGSGSDYDLVLLDQRMPGMEGLDVLRQMRQRNAGARIVMITAFGTIDLAVDAMKAGATDFLRKPFTTETLRGAVLGALSTAPGAVPPPSPPPARERYEPGPMAYGLTTVNGFHIESDPEAGVEEGGEIRHTFTVRHPGGQVEECIVLLPARARSDVTAFARRESMPGAERFWHAMCEHVLSNYIYQNAGLPPEGLLRVDEVDRGVRNWVRASLRATR